MQLKFTLAPTAVGAIAGAVIGRSLLAVVVGGVLGGWLLAPLFLVGAVKASN